MNAHLQEDKLPPSSSGNSRQLVTNYLLSRSLGGSWPYQPGNNQASVEATAWCSLALSDRPAVKTTAADFFVKSQNDDGGWSATPGAGPSDWSSALAFLALGRLSSQSAHESALERGLSYLLSSRAQIYDEPTAFFLGLMEVAAARSFPRGWPWAPGSFQWVEPTSYAVLALLNSKYRKRQDVKLAVQGAAKFFQSSTCLEGGWNHGNHTSLGARLPAYAVTTAQCLAALQFAPQLPEVSRALQLLSQKAQELSTPFALSWAILALDCLDQPFGNYLKALIRQQKEDGSFGRNVFTSGIAACALAAAEGINPIKLADAPKLDIFLKY